MDVKPKPLFEVRQIHPGATRRRALGVALLLAVVGLAGVAAGIAWQRHVTPPLATAAPSIPIVASAGTAQAAAQQIATLKRSEQIARVAAQDLRKTLADREEEISALRADLAFYANLVGSGEQGAELTVHGVHLQPVDGARAWNATITLTQNVRRGKENKGTVKLAVEGVRNGKLELLGWKQISAPDRAGGLAYAFKYFQQLHATVMLPDNFTPNRLRVLVDPADGKQLVHGMAWSDALKSAEENNVQQ